MKFSKSSTKNHMLILGIVIAMQYRSVIVNNSLAVYEQQRSSDLITDLLRERRIMNNLAKELKNCKGIENLRTGSETKPIVLLS